MIVIPGLDPGIQSGGSGGCGFTPSQPSPLEGEG